MADEYYKSALELGVQELADLMREREELDARREELSERIARVRQGVLGLSALAGYNPQALEMQYPHLFPDLLDSDIGLTDAVRKVLQANGKFMTPVGVRTGLRTLGFDIGRYKNPLASIHTVLKRLKDAGEVEPGLIEDNTAYKWKEGTRLPAHGPGGGTPQVVRPGNGRDPQPVDGPPSILPDVPPMKARLIKSTSKNPRELK